MPRGWIKLKDPVDMENAIARMINKILLSKEPLIHAGRFAALANAWINCRRLSLDSIEIQQAKLEIEELRKQVAENRHGRLLTVESR